MWTISVAVVARGPFSFHPSPQTPHTYIHTRTHNTHTWVAAGARVWTISEEMRAEAVDPRGPFPIPPLIPIPTCAFTCCDMRTPPPPPDTPIVL